MRSRLVAIAGSSYRAATGYRRREAARRGLASVSAGRTADPDVHAKERESEVKPAVFSGEPEETRKVYEPDPKPAMKRDVEPEHPKARGDSEPFAPPRPPHSTSPRLQSTPVNNPVEPNYQQKRNKAPATPLENVSCAGLDGSPWPEGDEQNRSRGNRGEADEDDREYFAHHKASPLSEIKFADHEGNGRDGGLGELRGSAGRGGVETGAAGHGRGGADAGGEDLEGVGDEGGPRCSAVQGAQGSSW